jgi:hypothetical protein
MYRKKKEKRNFTLLCNENEKNEDKEEMLETDSKQQILTEINNFEKMIIKVKDQSNPLEFYKSDQGVFEHLSKFAKMVFSL